jgi:hypothetical protein
MLSRYGRPEMRAIATICVAAFVFASCGSSQDEETSPWVTGAPVTDPPTTDPPAVTSPSTVDDRTTTTAPTTTSTMAPPTTTTTVPTTTSTTTPPTTTRSPSTTRPPVTTRPARPLRATATPPAPGERGEVGWALSSGDDPDAECWLVSDDDTRRPVMIFTAGGTPTGVFCVAPADDGTTGDYTVVFGQDSDFGGHCYVRDPASLTWERLSSVAVPDDAFCMVPAPASS